jgi:hypothetical protein
MRYFILSCQSQNAIPAVPPEANANVAAMRESKAVYFRSVHELLMRAWYCRK